MGGWAPAAPILEGPRLEKQTPRRVARNRPNGDICGQDYNRGCAEGLCLQDGVLLQALARKPGLPQLLGFSEGRRDQQRPGKIESALSLGVTEPWATSRLANRTLADKEMEAREEHAGPTQVHCAHH